MLNQFSRTELLLGKEAMQKLQNARVAVFGVGGVGGYAVDTVTAKIQLVLEARDAGVPIISSMGAGNKLDPTRFEVADIYETSVCPLAKVMRKELKKRCLL